jgi:hypothetical protein
MLILVAVATLALLACFALIPLACAMLAGALIRLFLHHSRKDT